MNELRKLVQGKSVAIIGGAAYLVDISQGEKIDSCDIVVRMHNIVPRDIAQLSPKTDIKRFVPQEWHERVGARTDVYAPDLKPLNHAKVRRLMSRFKDDGGSLALVHKLHNLYGSIPQIDIIHDEFAPLHICSPYNLIELSRMLDYAFPLPGTTIIHEILLHEPARVYHTGFSCFQDESRLTKQAEARLTRAHHPLLDLRYLRSLEQHRQVKVSTDEFMQNLYEKERKLG